MPKITKTEITRPPRMVVYGAHGVGKSTFAANCPSPIFIQTEDGIDSLGVEAFELAKSVTEVFAAIDYLIETSHPYKTVVIDSLDWLEKLIFAKVCDLKGVEDISAIPYGRGFTIAELEWKKILDKLNVLNSEKKMLVVLLAHSQIRKFDDPERASYDRYQLDLQNKAAALVAEYSDIVAFAAFKVATNTKQEGFSEVTKARTTGERILNVEERASFTAKNRYRLPPTLPLEWTAIASHLKALKKSSGNLTEIVKEKNEADLAKIAGVK